MMANARAVFGRTNVNRPFVTMHLKTGMQLECRPIADIFALNLNQLRFSFLYLSFTFSFAFFFFAPSRLPDIYLFIYFFQCSCTVHCHSDLWRNFVDRVFVNFLCSGARHANIIESKVNTWQKSTSIECFWCS